MAYTFDLMLGDEFQEAGKELRREYEWWCLGWVQVKAS